MDEPQAEQLVETLDHCGAPRAAGGADTSQAWYQLRARKRATFAKKNRDTFAEYLARYLIMHGGSRAPAQPKRLRKCLRINITLHQKG